jgi:ABC-2 type transport system ATP-binding protein
MEAMYKDIVEFAELEKFMDQKLKNYSSGMQVRLAFSIAIRAKTDILLLDEVLAVGDAAFQRKCFAYFGELKRNKQTVVFISHDMGSVRKYCDKAILIDNGKVVERGSIETVIEKYTGLFLESTSAAENSSTDNGIPLGMSPTGATDKSKMRILQATVCNAKGAKTTMLSDTDMNITVNIEVQALANVTDFVPGVIVQNTQGEFITASNSRWAGEQAKHALSAGERVTVSFELPNIYEKGDYIISANVVSDNLDTFYDWKNGFSKIYVDRPTETGASVNPRFKVRYR